MEQERKLRLRGHHLCCFLTFVGEGYDAPFAAHMRRMGQRLASGETFQIIAGKDDICMAEGKTLCPNRTCEGHGMAARDQNVLALLSTVNFAARPWAVGQSRHLTHELVWGFRRAMRAGVFDPICRPCDWKSFCENVSLGGFEPVLLFPKREAERADVWFERKAVCPT